MTFFLVQLTFPLHNPYCPGASLHFAILLCLMASTSADGRGGGITNRGLMWTSGSPEHSHGEGLFRHSGHTEATDDPLSLGAGFGLAGLVVVDMLLLSVELAGLDVEEAFVVALPEEDVRGELALVDIALLRLEVEFPGSPVVTTLVVLAATVVVTAAAGSPMLMTIPGGAAALVVDVVGEIEETFKAVVEVVGRVEDIPVEFCVEGMTDEEFDPVVELDCAEGVVTDCGVGEGPAEGAEEGFGKDAGLLKLPVTFPRGKAEKLKVCPFVNMSVTGPVVGCPEDVNVDAPRVIPPAGEAVSEPELELIVAVVAVLDAEETSPATEELAAGVMGVAAFEFVPATVAELVITVLVLVSTEAVPDTVEEAVAAEAELAVGPLDAANEGVLGVVIAKEVEAGEEAVDAAGPALEPWVVSCTGLDCDKVETLDEDVGTKERVLADDIDEALVSDDPGELLPPETVDEDLVVDSGGVLPDETVELPEFAGVLCEVTVILVDADIPAVITDEAEVVSDDDAPVVPKDVDELCEEMDVLWLGIVEVSEAEDVAIDVRLWVEADEL